MKEKDLLDALSKADACAAKSNFSEAIKKYQEIISLLSCNFPLDGSSLPPPQYGEITFKASMGLGRALRFSENYLAAITALNTALRILEEYPPSPKNPDAISAINGYKFKIFQYRAESKYNLFCDKARGQGLFPPNAQPLGEDRKYERTELKDIYQDLTTALIFFDKLSDNSPVKTIDLRLKMYSMRVSVDFFLGLYADAIKDCDIAIMLSDSETPDLFQLCSGRALAKAAMGDYQGAAQDRAAYDNAKSESRRQLEMAKQKGIARLSFFHHNDNPESLDKKTHIMHESDVPRMV